MSAKSFLLALIIIVLLGLAIGTLDLHQAGLVSLTTRYDWAHAGLGDHASREARLWRDVEYELQWTLGGGAEPFFGPLALTAARGYVYVTDYGGMRILKVSSSGELLSTFGRGKGQGPGEFQAITGVAIGKDDDVWVADVNNARLVRFSATGHLKDSVKVDPPPYRLISLDSKRFIVMNSHGASSMFSGYDDRGTVLFESAGLIGDYARNALALDGYISAVDEDTFAYASRYSGVMALFESDGDVRKVFQGVAVGELPQLARDSEGGTWLDDEAAPMISSLSSAGQRIYALSQEKRSHRGFDVADVYSSDGRYRYSLRLPEPCEKFAVHADRMYLASGASVRGWRLSEER